MRDYQVANQINISEIQTLPISQQKEQVVGVNKILKQRLTRFLVNPADEPILDKALEEVKEMVLASFEDL